VSVLGCLLFSLPRSSLLYSKVTDSHTTLLTHPTTTDDRPETSSARRRPVGSPSQAGKRRFRRTQRLCRRVHDGLSVMAFAQSALGYFKPSGDLQRAAWHLRFALRREWAVLALLQLRCLADVVVNG
jgi:hypothetical protein